MLYFTFVPLSGRGRKQRNLYRYPGCAHNHGRWMVLLLVSSQLMMLSPSHRYPTRQPDMWRVLVSRGGYRSASKTRFPVLQGASKVSQRLIKPANTSRGPGTRFNYSVESSKRPSCCCAGEPRLDPSIGPDPSPVLLYPTCYRFCANMDILSEPRRSVPVPR